MPIWTLSVRDMCLFWWWVQLLPKKQGRMADKVVQQWPKGKDSDTLKNSSHRRHSRWSLNLTALNSNIVLRQQSMTSVPDPAVSLFPARARTRACECYTKQGINSLSSSAAFDSSERPQTYTMSVWMRRVKSQTPQTRLVSKSEWHPPSGSISTARQQRLDLFTRPSCKIEHMARQSSVRQSRTVPGIRSSLQSSRAVARTRALGVKTRDLIVHGLWPGHLCQSDSLEQVGQAAKPVSHFESCWNSTNQNHPSIHLFIHPSIHTLYKRTGVPSTLPHGHGHLTSLCGRQMSSLATCPPSMEREIEMESEIQCSKACWGKGRLGNWFKIDQI